MFKKTVVAVFAISILALSFYTPAEALDIERKYMKGTFMLTKMHDSSLGSTDSTEDSALDAADAKVVTKLGFGFGVGFGMDFKDGWAAEGEYTFRTVAADEFTSDGSLVAFGIPAQADLDDADVTIHSFMVSGIKNFELESVTPYVGFGLGLAIVKVSASDLGASESAGALGYQFMLGLKKDINENMDIGGGYKLFGTTEPEIDDVTFSVLTSNFEVFLNYYF